MQTGREERLRPRHRRYELLLGVLLSVLACWPPIEQEKRTGPDMGRHGSAPVEQGTPVGPDMGRPGGRLVVALAAEPKTFNPAIVADLSSRAVVHRMTADLIHIDRGSQDTVPALAESWTISADGRRYSLKLRSGLRFSDGHPVDIEDVIFSFEVYLDEQIASPERSQLLIDGTPITVRGGGPLTVEFELPEPYAAAERLFDGFAILPRHRLEESYEAGRLVETWGLDTAAEDIVGLGPFRLQDYIPGERLVLERNPYYWQRDAAGQQLPYLDELVFLFTPTPEAQTLRFVAGELDVLDRVTPDDYASLSRQAGARRFRLFDLGPGLDYNFLFFNLNDLTGKDLPDLVHKQRWFRDMRFRQAILAAIDLEAIARLVYRGLAAPLASLETPGNRLWVDSTLEPPRRSLERARELLEDSGFRWDSEARLIGHDGQRVEFSILTAASSPQRTRMATVIQDDLRQLGLEVRLTSLELRAISSRLTEGFDYEACILGLSGGGASPNRMMNLLLSTGSHHLWHLGQDQPATPWEAEIDRLMQEQLTTLDLKERKRLYDRVQRIVAEKLPMISLVSPNVLVAAREGLGNFRPAISSHHTLWNAEELFWHASGE